MKKILGFLGLGIFIFTCCLFTFIIALIAVINTVFNDTEKFEYSYGDKLSKNVILEIHVNGLILDTLDDTNGIEIPGYVYGYNIKNLMVEASKNDEIKAIVLEISSPGGTITGSKAIYDGIEYYKEKTNNPVFVYIRGLAASGGYLASLSADKIYADNGSLTGSIGVIYGAPFQYYDNVVSEGNEMGYVVTQKGIESFYLSAGQYKDLGNPYRKITEDELKVLQNGLNFEYDNFINLVVENRKVEANFVKNNIKALIYSNDQAKELKLIDDVKTYDEVIGEVIKELDIEGEDYQVIRNKGWNLFSSLITSESKINQKTNALSNKYLLIYGDIAKYIQ